LDRGKGFRQGIDELLILSSFPKHLDLLKLKGSFFLEEILFNGQDKREYGGRFRQKIKVGVSSLKPYFIKA